MLPLAELPNVKNCLGKYAKDLGEIDVHNIEWICDLIKRVLASGSTTLHDLYVKMPISCNDGFTAFRRLIDMVDCPVMVRYISPRIVTISEEFERTKQMICDVEKFYRDSYDEYRLSLVKAVNEMIPGRDREFRDRSFLQLMIDHITAWKDEPHFVSQTILIEEEPEFFRYQNCALKRLIQTIGKKHDSYYSLQSLHEARVTVYNHLRKVKMRIV